MTLFITRVFIFTILPLLAAAIVAALDPQAKSRGHKLEIYLLYLFGLGVAGSGISGWFGHMFLSDIVAEGIGWEAGSPFQLEMGFANLALGVLGLIATARRDGFREATVTAVTVIGVGATIVHLIDIFETGNLSPGNTIQNIANLARPALLIYLPARQPQGRRAIFRARLAHDSRASYRLADGHRHNWLWCRVCDWKPSIGCFIRNAGRGNDCMDEPAPITSCRQINLT